MKPVPIVEDHPSVLQGCLNGCCIGVLQRNIRDSSAVRLVQAFRSKNAAEHPGGFPSREHGFGVGVKVIPAARVGLEQSQVLNRREGAVVWFEIIEPDQRDTGGE